MLTILPDDNVVAHIIRWDAIPTLIKMLESTDDAPAAVEALNRLFLNGVQFFDISGSR